MTKLKPLELTAEAHRVNLEQVARLGGDLGTARRRRRLTQAEAGAAAGIARATVGAIERGRAGGHTLDALQRLALAVGRPLRLELARDPQAGPADAGHLAIQELVIRLGRRAGYTAFFELPTRPGDPLRSADVGLRDDRGRRLLLVECWNTIGDIGAAARSSSRKLAEAEALAIALGGDRPHRIAGCWVVRATKRNRDLVARYPEVFAARFPGSSVGWVRALVAGSRPPSVPGLVWVDVPATRLFSWRRPGHISRMPHGEP